MTKRFEKSYNALYNAFMNNTLAKGSCMACAVGNIIADAMGLSVEKNNDEYEYTCSGDNKWWSELFLTAGNTQIFCNINDDCLRYRKKIKYLTGYSWKEMAKIEYAFEINTKYNYLMYDEMSEKDIMDDQFNGLMGVMDVLLELDNISEGKKYKDSFKKKLEHA